jgi:hypothetical protein
MITGKTAEWIKDISTKNELKKAFDYEGISLWGFYEHGLYSLVEDYKKNKKSNDRGIFKSTKIILKIAKYYFISKAITRYILDKIITKRKKNKQLENGSTYKVLAVSFTSYWKNYPTHQKESKDKETNRDTMLGNVIMALRNKNFNMVALDQDTTFFIDFKTMIEKRIHGRRLWRPAEAYLTFDIIKKTFKAAKKYEEEWDKLKNNKEFIDSLNYYDIRLSNLLKDFFEKIFKYSIFSLILYIELMKRAVEIEKTDLILITCGYCKLGKAATIAGKLKGVPTLEIQHGVIHPSHSGYIYAKDEIPPEGSVNSPYCPIPDKTAVYGYYHKELLTNVSTYPVDSVIVTGQPRYDVLADADKIYSKEKFLSDYRIDPNHKIILWTTQCHGISDEENIKNFKAVFEIMQNIENATLIIKQHPREGEIYTKTIKDYLDKYKIDAVITPKSSDTYEQLFVCDLMITRHSTTAMEAVALNKSVIILNLSGEPDPVEYVKEGVALGVYKPEDLKPTIEKLLKEDSELAKNREKYIEKYLYKIDGKATERVVNLIERMIESSKQGEK